MRRRSLSSPPGPARRWRRSRPHWRKPASIYRRTPRLLRTAGHAAAANRPNPSHPAANLGRRRRHQPVRAAPRRLGRDARSRHGRPRGDRPSGGDPLGRTGVEERHRAGSVQAADRQPRHPGRADRDHPEGAAGAGGHRNAGAARAGCRRRRRRAVRRPRVALRGVRGRLAAARCRCPGARAGADRRLRDADTDRGICPLGRLPAGSPA